MKKRAFSCSMRARTPPTCRPTMAGLRKRLAAFSKKHPDLCRCEKSFAQGGVIYVLDKSKLSIRLQAPYSEERRRKVSDSHGVGAKRINISDHHARLFVNSAMTMADFVLAVSEKDSL